MPGRQVITINVWGGSGVINESTVNKIRGFTTVRAPMGNGHGQSVMWGQLGSTGKGVSKRIRNKNKVPVQAWQ